jgi:hypothetical protein
MLNVPIYPVLFTGRSFKVSITLRVIQSSGQAELAAPLLSRGERLVRAVTGFLQPNMCHKFELDEH